MRLLARPVGLSGSGPTLWALYPSRDEAEAAARPSARPPSTGTITPPGDGDPTVIATTHRPAPTTSISPGGDHDPSAPSRPPEPRRRSGRTARPSPSTDFVFCSGQVGLDPATGELVAGGVEAQTERVMANLSAVLDAAGLTWATS